MLSTHAVSLFYCVESSTTLAALPADQTWQQINFVSEQFSESVSTTEQLSLSSNYSVNSRSLSDISVSGSFSCYFSISELFVNLLLNVTKSVKNLLTTQTIESFSASNGNTDSRFSILKMIDRGDEVDYFVYRLCDASSLSLTINAESLVTINADFEAETVERYLDQDPDNLNAAIAGWQFQSRPSELTAGYFAVKDIAFSGEFTAFDIIAQSLSLSFTKEIERASVLGTYPRQRLFSGVQNFSVSGEFYYHNYRVLQAVVNQDEIAVTIVLSDGQGKEFTLEFPATQIVSSTFPTAGSADQDLMFNAEFAAVPNNAAAVTMTYEA